MNKDIIGNITTIGKIIAMAIAGWFIGYCVSKGINLPVDQETLSEILFTIFLLIWSYFDAKYHNSFFNTPTPTVESEEPVMNDEYECDGDEDGC